MISDERKEQLANKKRKRRVISEQGISDLLKRYSVETIFTLLQEVANHTYKPSSSNSSSCSSSSSSSSSSLGVIDWKFLAANTATPLSNPAEYHSLWRILASYPPSLSLDDQSDLDDDDYPNGDEDDDNDDDTSSLQASAYAKLHIASSSFKVKDDHSNNAIQAPMTIQHASNYFFIPVFVPKQRSLPIEQHQHQHQQQQQQQQQQLDASKRKCKPWTPAEDDELIAAVRRFGEGNWAIILRQDFFKGDRTATQLSQRWGILKKRRVNSSLSVSTSLPQLSEVQLAARNAISAALDFPVGNLRSLSSIATASNMDNTEAANGTATSSRVGSLSSSTKTQIPPTKLPTKPCLSPNSMVKATAVAAGARIGTPEDAASFLKAAQANNAVHIMPCASGSVTPPISTHLGAHKNVHILSTGKAISPRDSKPLSVKPMTPIVQSMNSTDANTASCKQIQESNPTDKMQVDDDLTDEICPSKNEVIQDDEKRGLNIANADKDFTVKVGDDSQFEEEESKKMKTNC